MPRLLFFCFILFSACCLHAQAVTQDLCSNWEFSESGKNEWLPAKVPGTVHTDLLAAKKIPDPYLYTNESGVQWVENKTWEYRTRFDCSKSTWKQKKKQLVFEGLDTYAKVYLNDSLILTATNMFRTYTVDVERPLHKKNNLLRIVFLPASELIGQNRSQAEVQNLPGGERVFIRKAQYQFGWDWSPRLVTCGIWKKVRLEAWSGQMLDHFDLVTDAIQDDTAYLRMSFDFRDALAVGQEVSVTVRENGWELYSGKWKNPLEYNRAVDMQVLIAQPKLWWCNGLGKPYLYDLECEIRTGKKKFIRRLRFGIRKIELDQHPDRHGSAFLFYLNDKPVFIKGANWIPGDNFLPRMQPDKYRRLLNLAAGSNMNMLRVWGGGAYEDDYFYHLCDSLGIMVWQDFMFACGMYPTNPGFMSDLHEEFTGQIDRLISHPSIVIWCGNNENTEGWFNWGWQKEMKMSRSDSLLVANGYFELFYTQMRLLLYAYDRNVIYWPSSPSIGWGHSEAYKEGDVHYWGVWWGQEPFSAYDSHVGRFVTEYGFQGMPDERSFAAFAGKRYFDLKDSVIRAHQKHPTGYETINAYMQRDYPVPANFFDYLYVSQVVQRDGMQRAIEAHRRTQPYCMGTVFWQFNDCWPVTSWSSVDYYERPKLFQYALPSLYAPVMISVTERNDSVLLYLINDDTLAHNGELSFRWTDFSGKVYRFSQGAEYLPENSSMPAAGFRKKLLLDTLAASDGVLTVVYRYEGNRSVEKNYYFAPVKDLHLQADPGISLVTEPAEGEAGTFFVSLKCTSLARDIYLATSDESTRFSDNGFDLLPGAEKKIKVKSSLSQDELRKNIRVYTMNGMISR